MVSDDSTSSVMAIQTLVSRHRDRKELTLASKGLDEDLHVVICCVVAETTDSKQFISGAAESNDDETEV